MLAFGVEGLYYRTKEIAMPEAAHDERINRVKVEILTPDDSLLDLSKPADRALAQVLAGSALRLCERRAFSQQPRVEPLY
jgi:hypothetical protein